MKPFRKLEIKPDQKVWITSDLHLGHKNIVTALSEWGRRGTRDFSSIEEMNDYIINQINKFVKSDDFLIIMGDFAFGGHALIPEYRKRINCQNIILIYGNHDDQIRKRYQHLFTECHDYLQIRFGGKDIVLSHYPITSWRDMSIGSLHIHGHIHSSPENWLHENSRSCDVGIDGTNNYSPYCLEDIVEILKDRPIGCLTLKSDHHGDTNNVESSRIPNVFRRYWDKLFT